MALPQNERSSPEESEQVILRLRELRNIRPLPPRARAWERALAALDAPVTFPEVKAAWEAVKLARLGHDPELFDLRLATFKLKLEALLNA